MHYYSASRHPEHEKKETIVQVDAREAILGMKMVNSIYNYDSKDGDNENAKLLENAVQTKLVAFKRSPVSNHLKFIYLTTISFYRTLFC